MPVGDTALAVQFKQEISREVNRQVTTLANRLAARRVKGIVEFVPTYCTLMIHYNPMEISYQEIVALLDTLDESDMSLQEMQRTVWIPVLYGGQSGPDLEELARYHGLTPGEVAQLHSSALYHVYMIGFSPGFPYLGGLPPQIATPRLTTPRAFIPAGSVGIAGSQTGIYSLSTPGGWRIIGHTPLPLFRPQNEGEPFLLRAGDQVKFVPVSDEDYREIAEQIKRNTYTPHIVEQTCGRGGAAG